MELCTFVTPSKVLKAINLIKIGVLWAWKNLWGYGKIILIKFGAWGRPGTGVMTIFESYVSAQIPNVEYFEYMEVYMPREVSHLFSPEISHRMPSESYLGTNF